METLSERRVRVLSRHLTSGGDSTQRASIKDSTRKVLENTAGRWHGVDPLTVDVNVVGEPLPPQVRGKILHFMDQLADLRADPDSGYDVAQVLPGPTQDVGPDKRYATLKDLLLELQQRVLLLDADARARIVVDEVEEALAANLRLQVGRRGDADDAGADAGA